MSTFNAASTGAKPSGTQPTSAEPTSPERTGLTAVDLAATLPPVRDPLRRLWRHGRPHRSTVIAAMACTSLNKLFDVMPELLIGVAIDIVVNGRDSFAAAVFGLQDRFSQLVAVAVVNAVVWVLESATQYAAALLWRNLAQTVEHELRIAAYANVQSLDVAWFDEVSSGGVVSVLNDDVNQLERFLDVGASRILLVFWNVVLVGAVFFATSWLLAVLAFAPIPVIVIGSTRFQRRLEPFYATVRERVGVLSGTLTANLAGITTIKAFAAEGRELARLRAVSQAYREANAAAIRYSSAFVPLIRMVILAGFTTTLLLGGRMVLDGQLAVGLYSVLVFMTQRLLWPLTDLGEVLDLYQRAMASTRRIFGVLDLRPDVVEGRHEPATPVRGELAWEGVRFGYGDGPDVLCGLDIAVPAGATHAVVGTTGAGKSTLVRLLLRFGEPRAGRVSLDGADLRELTYSGLRRAIGYVGQDVFLFHGSVRDNIAYGRPDATDEQVRAAAALAEAHEFIEALPAGYDTVVGERGQKLSGGQRQRLSIARAVLLDPPVLVLDEATSAVDNETEAAIQRSMARVGADRTVLVIAHRLSTVRDADRIWVLADGRAAEAGSHDELLAADGRYAALWRVQTGEARTVPDPA